MDMQFYVAFHAWFGVNGISRRNMAFHAQI